MTVSCEHCTYNCLDDETGEAYCLAPLDEDELCRLLEQGRSCPYFRTDGDDYALVRHQN